MVSLAAILAISLTTTGVPEASEGQDSARQATHSVSATATFGPRTSLHVSSQVLRFDVTDALIPAEASVEFAAGARTRNGGDVVLVVQVGDPSASPAGSTAYALTIAHGSEGVAAGAVVHGAPAVVARWAGGGMRTGRVTFRLNAPPGRYELPIKFLVNQS